MRNSFFKKYLVWFFIYYLGSYKKNQFFIEVFLKVIFYEHKKKHLVIFYHIDFHIT